MKTFVKIAVFAVMVMFGSSASAQDPRCTATGYIGNAIVGAAVGVLIGDSHRAAGIGAGSMVGVQAITCATQSYRRVTTYGGGQQYQGQPQYYGNGQQYYGNGNQYYEGGVQTYRPRYYNPQPYDNGQYYQQPEPYYVNGVHYNPHLGLCKFARGQGPAGYHPCP